MLSRRTDLAVEAHQIWQESAQEQTQLKGVAAEDDVRNGCAVTRVRILDQEGADTLGKPPGNYITVELSGFHEHENEPFSRCVQALRDEFVPLIGDLKEGCVLVVGLGNRAITPDAIGPLAVENLMVTRHLVERLPDMFGHMRQVAALAPGVLGNTGVESAEIIRGVVERTKPDLVIIIDALASRSLARLCTTVQLADTGIVPGSGVGNARAAINKETLGVPVIALGVPTVVDAATLAADLLEQSGHTLSDPSVLAPDGNAMVVTPKEIDTQVRDIAKVVGYALNMSLHENLSIADVTEFLS